MACRPVRFWIAAGIGLGTLAAQGQTAAPAALGHSAALTDAIAPAAPATAPASLRPLSSEIAGALTAMMPKYSPPKAARPNSGTEGAAEAPPKNGIVRLPVYVIHEAKIRQFTERELYTHKGLAELAVRRYLTEFDYGVLNRFTLPLYGSPPEARAMKQYVRDEKKKNDAEIHDLMELEKIQ